MDADDDLRDVTAAYIAIEFDLARKRGIQRPPAPCDAIAAAGQDADVVPSVGRDVTTDPFRSPDE